MEKKILMPKRLTAENEAKYAFIGEEFTVTIPIACRACSGSGYDPDTLNDDCEDCNGAGFEEYTIPIPWPVIKEIYAAAVKLLGTPKE